ncbi:MAG: DUF4032 domain-containing protein [Verrucomicrobiales bacterium]|jgi:hypothetical protein|nr:DUF4032 domain-containing protein [Verrucomicrobiales bacterium]
MKIFGYDLDRTRRLGVNSGIVSAISPDTEQYFKNSALYREFLAERDEILKHKWIESEKVGHDIGFEQALLDWIVKHRSTWRTTRKPRVS